MSRNASKRLSFEGIVLVLMVFVAGISVASFEYVKLNN